MEDGEQDRSRRQREAALARANAIRMQRAQIKRELKAGRRSILDLIADPPAGMETAKVSDMLLAVPKLGRVGASKALAACSISPSKTLGALTRRQRTQLVATLRGAPPSGRNGYDVIV